MPGVWFRCLVAVSGQADADVVLVTAGSELVRPVAAGGDGQWRVRTGDFRIVYEVHDDVLLVLVVAVGHRRDSYQRR